MKILTFNNIYKYLNSEMQLRITELLAAGKLKEKQVGDVKLYHNGGEYTDWAREYDTITLADDIEVRVFENDLEITNFTKDGRKITFAAAALDKFYIDLQENTTEYLYGLKQEYLVTEIEFYKTYRAKGVIEGLPIELEDTRTVAYYQPIVVRVMCANYWRENYKIVFDHFCSSLNDTITVLDSYSVQFRVTQMPSFTASYKAHGIDEFDCQFLIDCFVAEAPDFSDDERLYINGEEVPYIQLDISKDVTLDADTAKKPNFEYVGQKNDMTIRVVGNTYSDNEVLQAIKKDIRSATEYNKNYLVEIRLSTSKGAIKYEFNGDPNSIIISTHDDIVVYFNGELLDSSEYSVNKVPPVGGQEISVIDFPLGSEARLAGDTAYAERTKTTEIYNEGDSPPPHTYNAILQRGTVTNVYGGNIAYEITLVQRSTLVDVEDVDDEQ